MKAKKPKLPAAPLKALFVQVEGKPGPSIVFDPPGSVIGFYRVLGMTVKAEGDLVDVARRDLATEGSSLVGVEDVWLADFEGDDADKAEDLSDVSSPGVWYRSGHAFFGPDEE